MDADFLLIRKIEKGNEQAMDQFVLKHYPKIYQYCLLRVRDHGYAEDLTQETFLKFFQAFERYKHYGKALNYLYVIAGNLCKDHFRKEGRMEVYEMSEEIAVEHMGQVEKRMEIYEALDKLPEEIREVVILFFFQEISQKEIARMMGIKLSLVKYRVSKSCQPGEETTGKISWGRRVKADERRISTKNKRLQRRYPAKY